MVKRYLYDYKRVHFPDLQRFVFRTVVWTKNHQVLRYRSKQSSTSGKKQNPISQLKKVDIRFLLFQIPHLGNNTIQDYLLWERCIKKLSYTIGLSRSNKGVNPIFPTYGSEFSISAKLTAPYSLINGTDYATLGDKEAYKLKNTVNRNNQLDANGNTVAIGDYIDAGNKVFNFKMLLLIQL
jgi:hypothetical protein